MIEKFAQNTSKNLDESYNTLRDDENFGYHFAMQQDSPLLSID